MFLSVHVSFASINGSHYVCSINIVVINLFSLTEFSSRSDWENQGCLRLHSILRSDPDPETIHFWSFCDQRQTHLRRATTPFHFLGDGNKVQQRPNHARMRQLAEPKTPRAQAQLPLQRSPARDSRAPHPTPNASQCARAQPVLSPSLPPHNAHVRVRAAHTSAVGARPGKFHTQASSTLCAFSPAPGS